MIQEPRSGLFVVNKPEGVTSFWVVGQLKRLLKVKKAGHCGTLDPLATGILLILVGKSTRHQSFFMDLPKTYRAVFQLGVKTDTGDTTGKIIEQKVVGAISKDDVEKVISKFKGEINQVPPMYSALKYGGKKLYELARRGLTVKREPRKITIYDIFLLGLGNDWFELLVRCSRGTYVRTLGEDIGNELGCGAAMSKLCRESVGGYRVEDAIDGSRLGTYTKDEIEGRMISENDFLKLEEKEK
jgi:tRNA pseudouridine55 synthase